MYYQIATILSYHMTHKDTHEKHREMQDNARGNVQNAHSTEAKKYYFE